DFALGLGAELGRRVTEKLSGEALSLAGWTEHVGGQLALLGLGNLSAERWGRALVLRVSGSPSDAVELLSGVLEGALLRGWSRSARLVAFPSDGSVAFLVASESTAQRARGLAEGGQGLGSVIDVLHQGGAS
ncbi:MAG TPA: hypothetical protein VLC09_15005, partial [Polyangiaceae bacterium]|nr:hypothetical protein [Polyangiaceae bacterium]